jgi:hypothetical protein
MHEQTREHENGRPGNHDHEPSLEQAPSPIRTQEPRNADDDGRHAEDES